jgi:hypothetical protein
MVGTIGRLLREALWAPLAIIALNVVVARLPQAGELWWLLHFLGGAALAFCCFRLARIPGALRYVLAFSVACTVALGWELAEFAIDQMAGTALQEGRADTMSDLMFSVCGAALFLGFAAIGWKAPGGR